jgi:hypothetical protein
LVTVEAERIASSIRPKFSSEDAAALRVQFTLSDQFVDRLAGLEGRVELDERLGPQHSLIELAIDELSESRLADVDEAAGVAGVVVNKLSAEAENIQRNGSIAHRDVLGWATSNSRGPARRRGDRPRHRQGQRNRNLRRLQAPEQK